MVAPVTWILVTLGQDGSARTVDSWVEIGQFNSANLIEPAVWLVVGGVLLGLLGTLRVSPIGPIVAGLLLAVPYLGLAISPFAVRNRIPADWTVLGDPLPLRLPLENGTLFLIGLLLLVAGFSGQRWRQWPTTKVEPKAAENPDPADTPLDDWPPTPERESTEPVLGNPKSDPTEALPRQTDGESPWSTPPRGNHRPTTTTGPR
ncbi:hypothetical protein [Salinispora cortesiana]|uniref:hypothetical protein n=1 Tax=Salinispora cortesiana TaxID=1305843 RepID=UPI000471470C|nr:hypothetical protein [Salinispora cortesiana]